MSYNYEDTQNSKSEMISILNKQYKQKSYLFNQSELVLQSYTLMDKFNEHTIFFEEKHSTTIQQVLPKQMDCPQGIPYLKRGDSSVYVEQFLMKEQELIPHPSPKIEIVKKQQISSEEVDQSFQISDNVKFNPSAFHNFQKHLTVCLKHSIHIPSEDRASKDYHRVASKLWKAFKNSNTSTKKILHYLLGQKNEHPITEAGLKEYGLNKIYEAYPKQVLIEARNYLAVQTLRQIREGNVQSYINAKKLKNKEKFKQYVEIFVEELNNGFLKKRLPKEKVAYLLNS